MEAITTAMETAFTAVQTSAADMLPTILGPAVGILSLFIIAKLGIRFFTGLVGR